jgi:hypothetical protein
VASERVKFTFPQDLVNTPVIYNMGKEFGVVTNIRRANLSHDRGWVILEVVGTAEAIEKSLTWAREQGVRIEPAESAFRRRCAQRRRAPPSFRSMRPMSRP